MSKQKYNIKLKMETQDDVPTFMVKYKILDNPTALIKGGYFIIDICNYLSEIIENINRDEICSMLTGSKYETLEHFTKEIKKKQTKDYKRTKVKEENFVPKDEDGKVVKKISPYFYYCSNIKKEIKSEDMKNSLYFKNDRFNKNIFCAKKWESLKSNKVEYNKLIKKVDTINSKILTKIEKLKEESGYIRKPKKPKKNAYLLYKNDKAKSFEKYYNKNKDKLKHTRIIEFTKYTARRWKEETPEVKEQYQQKVNEKYEKDLVEYTKQLDLWEKYQNKKLLSNKKDESDEELDEVSDNEQSDSEEQSDNSTNDETNNTDENNENSDTESEHGSSSDSD